MKRLLVNDCLTCIPGTRTFWHDLKEWFHMDSIEAPYDRLATLAAIPAKDASLIIRNATYFGPIEADCPQISILQDIIDEGPPGGNHRVMQEAVVASTHVVYNSEFTKHWSHYNKPGRVIPLSVDFDLFKPGNPVALREEMEIPYGSICWIGACQKEAGYVKGWDTLVKIARMNPDLRFMAVMKDGFPETFPPNMRIYLKLKQEELVKVMGACMVGLCTSRIETQHLAGIEMGGCGLPLVVPPIGAYFNRTGMPGIIVGDPKEFTTAIRAALSMKGDAEYWKGEFSPEVVKAQWKKLVEEVECSGAS
jgi:glycosyltransferase involved in cell wall biosynthesis